MAHQFLKPMSIISDIKNLIVDYCTITQNQAKGNFRTSLEVITGNIAYITIAIPALELLRGHHTLKNVNCGICTYSIDPTNSKPMGWMTYTRIEHLPMTFVTRPTHKTC